MSHVYPYPTLPQAVSGIESCIGYFRKTTDGCDAVNGAWAVLGYAASIGVECPHGGFATAVDELGAANELEACLASNAGDHQAIPWSIVLPIVVDLFLRLFLNRK